MRAGTGNEGVESNAGDKSHRATAKEATKKAEELRRSASDIADVMLKDADEPAPSPRWFAAVPDVPSPPAEEGPWINIETLTLIRSMQTTLDALAKEAAEHSRRRRGAQAIVNAAATAPLFRLPLVSRTHPAV